MSTSAIQAIETAFYFRCANDSTLTGLTAIVNYAPDDQAYPYVLIGNPIEKGWRTFGGDSGNGKEARQRLHIYSLYAGDQEALTILNRLVALFDGQSLSVSGYSTALVTYDQGRVLNEINKDKLQVRHIPAEFLVRVHV